MRAAGLATLFALALTAFLAALVPASYALRQAEAGSRQAFAAFEERGTLWSGSARLRIATPSGTFQLERVSWSFRPASLLAARIGFDVTAQVAGAEGHAVVERGLDGWQVVNARARAEAAAIAHLVPLAAAWKPEGRIDFVAPRFAFDGRTLEGRAELLWRDAGLALAQVKPLGTYRLEISASGGPAALTLSTVSGALRASGKGTFAPPGAFSLSGEARAEGAQAAQLQPVLDLLGPRRADGSHALELRLR